MKRRIHLTILVLWNAVVALIVWGQPAAQAQAPVVPDDVAGNIRARVTNSFTPGIVVGMISSNGITYFGYGLGNLDGGAAVNEDSVFEIGSITKTFTCTVLSQMLRDGSMVLTNAVQNYLPNNVSVPGRNGKVITLQYLATHWSGLPRLPTNFNPADILNPYADYTVQQMYSFLSSYQLPRAPGASFEYSNLGMGLLGYILSLKSGLDYQTLVSARVTQKLGMNDTGITLNAPMASRLARGHTGVIQVPNWDFGPAFVGAGALRSTARDLLQYVGANMGLVQSDLYPAMTNAQAVLAPAFPGSSIGMAWFTTPVPGDQMIWHDGGTGGYTSYAGFLRNKKVGVVVLANSDVTVDDIGAHLLDPSQPLNSISVPVPVSLETLRSCVGRYQDGGGNHFDIGLVHGHLTAAYSPDQGLAFTLYPSSLLSFFATIVDGSATFKTNSQGMVNQLLWTQSGQSLPCARVPLPAQLSIQHANGETQIGFTGDTGVDYILEAAADLIHWTPISTNTIWTAPVIDKFEMSSRFYRLRRE